LITDRGGAESGPPLDTPADDGSLGLLFPLVVVTALGVLLISLADRAAREGSRSKEELFWTGLAVIVLPMAARLCSAEPGRRERIWLVLTFGLGMYLAKVAYSPSRIAFSDEFIHLRSVQDDLSTGHLFSFNPLLPEAARYPGLGDVTVALVRLTGLSISTAGFIVIGSARLVLMLVIVLLAEKLSHSSRVAGLAAFLYAANPNFLYWSAQFSYESLALPLALFVIYLVARRSEGTSSRLSGLAAASIVAVVITHHLSSYFMAFVLLAWTVVVLVRRILLGRQGEYDPSRLAALAVLSVGIWLTTVASITGPYLGSIASSTSTGLFNVVTGAAATRKLFTSGSEVAPLWERGLSVAAVLITLGGLLYGALLIWRRRRSTPLMLAPLTLALLYPLLLPLRLIASAAETANRSSEFLFLGLGAVLASAAVGCCWLVKRAGVAGTLVVALLAALVVAGGAAVSWQYSERLPQDSSKPGVPHEVTASALAAYEWTDLALGPGRRFATDFLNHLGIAGYALQRPLYAPDDRVSAWQIMAPETVTDAVRKAIREGRVEYVMIDRRLSDGIPASGYYFDKGEPGAGEIKSPVSQTVLSKFDHAKGASRLYDNGDLQIYSVGGLR